MTNSAPARELLPDPGAMNDARAARTSIAVEAFRGPAAPNNQYGSLLFQLRI